MTVNNVNDGHGKPIRFVLSAEQSDTLAGFGDTFACIGRGSHPDAVGRLVLYLVPVASVEAVNGAVAVAMGDAKVARQRRAKV